MVTEDKKKIEEFMKTETYDVLHKGTTIILSKDPTREREAVIKHFNGYDILVTLDEDFVWYDMDTFLDGILTEANLLDY